MKFQLLLGMRSSFSKSENFKKEIRIRICTRTRNGCSQNNQAKESKHPLKYFVSSVNGETSTSEMFVVLVTLFAVSFVSALWPVPIVYSAGNSTVVLASDFAIQFNGPNGTSNGGVDTSKKVYRAIDETYALLDDGFIPYMLYPFEEDYEPSSDEFASAPQLSSLVITQT